MAATTATDSRVATFHHIHEVQSRLRLVIVELLARQQAHDRSKLISPEVEYFDLAAELRTLTYGSAEYKAALAGIQPGLDHHYAVNRHHPEHHADGIRGMTLVDLIEMLCDWLAATLRHADGDIRRSIEINQARFGYSDELKQIFLNTLPVIEEPVSEKLGSEGAQ